MIKLHADLRKYVDMAGDTRPGHGGFPMLRHPLIHTIYHEEMNPHINNTYVGKLNDIEAAEKSGDYARAIWMRERPYRVDALYMYASLLHREQLVPLVQDVWVDTEFPHQSMRMWLWLWDRIAPITKPNVRFKLDQRKTTTSARVKMYRGQSGTKDNRPDGISWTLDKDRAGWFMDRFPGDYPQLLMRTVRTNEVIDRLTSRGEDEIIYIPGELRNVLYT